MTLEEARDATSLDFKEEKYLEVINDTDISTDQQLQDQEIAFGELAGLYVEQQSSQKLQALVASARHVTGRQAKSKTAKVIRMLVGCMSQVEGSFDDQIATIKECVEWTIQENRAFLRQNLQVRLIALYLEVKSFSHAIQLIDELLKELKRLDDKMMLVEVQLLQAKVYYALRNLAKSRASLTSARTSANSVYCPTLMQAQLDTMSGILQAEDGEYKTAYSYFYEAFEGYNSIGDGFAPTVLNYLFLVKIMLNLTNDIEQLSNNKHVQKYQSRSVTAMKAMAKAHSERSLKEFEKVLVDYKEELSGDAFIRSHFSLLYDRLLEENLVKVIEPYSCVEISYLAGLLGLDLRQVEGKLSQMILDKVFYGVIDQGHDWLFVYPEPELDETYKMSLETIKQMSGVVDMLYDKASIIN